MEAARKDEGLLNTIRPPRLEDAGLEDSESIKDAIFKVADSIRSRAISVLNPTDDDHCVQDPGPTNGESHDSLIGISPTSEPPPRPCGTEKGGGLPEMLGDKVVVGVTEGGSSDRVLGSEEVVSDGGKACVDELQGLKKGDEDEAVIDRDEEEKDGEPQPILAETYV